MAPLSSDNKAPISAAYAAGPDARSAPAGAPSAGAGSEVGEIGEKAKQLFGQGLATVTVRSFPQHYARGNKAYELV